MADNVSQLLSQIYKASNLTYMSDLRSSKTVFSLKVKETILKISEDQYSLTTWNKAASYLADQEIQLDSIKQIKEFLIQLK